MSRKRRNNDGPKPLHPFKGLDQDKAAARIRKRSHIFAIGVHEVVSDGLVVAAHANGHDIASAKKFGVRPGDAENIIVDPEGIWDVDDWLRRNVATHVCAHTPREVAAYANRCGQPVAKTEDSNGFERAQRQDIHKAAKIARGKKVHRLVEEHVDNLDLAPAGP